MPETIQIVVGFDYYKIHQNTFPKLITKQILNSACQNYPWRVINLFTFLVCRFILVMWLNWIRTRNIPNDYANNHVRASIFVLASAIQFNYSVNSDLLNMMQSWLYAWNHPDCCRLWLLQNTSKYISKIDNKTNFEFCLPKLPVKGYQSVHIPDVSLYTCYVTKLNQNSEYSKWLCQ